MKFHKFRTATKFFSLGGRSEIFDEYDDLAYVARGNPFSFLKKYTLTSTSDNTEYTIQQKGFVFNISFIIRNGKKIIAVIDVPFSFKTPTLHVKNHEGRSFAVEGNFWGNNYKFVRGIEEFGVVSSSVFNFPGNYGIAIKEGENIPLILCIVIVIGIIKRRRNN